MKVEEKGDSYQLKMYMARSYLLTVLHQEGAIEIGKGMEWINVRNDVTYVQWNDLLNHPLQLIFFVFNIIAWYRSPSDIFIVLNSKKQSKDLWNKMGKRLYY